LKNKFFIYAVVFVTFISACGKNNSNDDISPGGQIIPGSASERLNLTTNKAVYSPGEIIHFTTAAAAMPASSIIRYKHLNEVIDETDNTGQLWSWQAPTLDFKGYLIEVYTIENGREIIQGTIAVDVSSDSKRFPRYGFLSDFSMLSAADMDEVVENLNRHHINWIQFYDWSEKHHKPLAGTVSNPSENWLDIAYRPTYKSTVEGYIERAHEKGMKTMAYNLCYGALDDAADDGVQNEWYMFDDRNHTNKTVFDIGSFLKSPIFLMDASNPGWQQYLAERNSDMYAVFDFDGYHIDQLGDWGVKYTYDGDPINIALTYGSFIQAMKSAHPDKKLVMNAVNQYAQEGVIGNSATDFLYTEVWNPYESYSDLAQIIKNNSLFSISQKNSVLAAYINYNLAEQAGSFNSPAVLFADAVIFAFGGAHLELGEHMLGKEYFPNDNLQMSAELKDDLISYYDFSVAYQNLLRDGGSFNSPDISSIDESVTLSDWPPKTGSVAVIGKQLENRQIIHLINFSTNTLDWRDTNGTKTTPFIIDGLRVTYGTNQQVNKIWFASPDLNFGSAFELDFESEGDQVTFVVPYLKYWDMLVIE